VNYDIRTEQIYNNLIVLGQQNDSGDLGEYYYGNNNRFAKHHLLPVGEFIPFEQWLRGLAPIFDLPMSSFTRGEYIQPNLLANNLYLLPAICFEIVFPRQIRANITPSTDTIITVSNDAWFGDSAGPIQHMRIAQVRAKEFGLPVIRATNNGITGIINGQGEIEAQIPQFTTAVLEHELSLKRYATPFKIYGNRLFISYLLLVVLLSITWVFLPKILAREL
jgi:apolipoprotein N-acyltransferase